MADEKIKFEDFFADDIFSKLQQLQDELAGLGTTFDELKRQLQEKSTATLNEIRQTQNESTAVANYAQEVEKLTRSNEALADAMAKTAALYKQTEEDLSRASQAYKKLGENITWTQEDLQAFRSALKAGREAINTQALNLDTLKLAYKAVVNELHSMTQAELESTDKGRHLSDMAKRMQVQMKEMENAYKMVNAQKRQLSQLTDEEKARVDALKASVAAMTVEELGKLNIDEMQKKSYNELSAIYTVLKNRINQLTGEERALMGVENGIVAASRNVYETMNQMQQATGKYALNVGNYKTAWDGLSFSLNQVIREIPSAMNINQFFLAISNNIPMLMDEINRFKQGWKKNMEEELAKTTKDVENLRETGGEAYEAALAQQKALNTELAKGAPLAKKIGTALMSWNTVLVVVLMILRSIDWKGVLDSVKRTITGMREIAEKSKDIQEAWGKIGAGILDKVANTEIEIGLCVQQLKRAVKDSDEWRRAVGRINELMGSNKQLTADTVEGIEAQTRAFIEQQKQLAKNEMIVKMIADNVRAEYKRDYMKNTFLELLQMGPADQNGIRTTDDDSWWGGKEYTSAEYNKKVKELSEYLGKTKEEVEKDLLLMRDVVSEEGDIADMYKEFFKSFGKATVTPSASGKKGNWIAQFLAPTFSLISGNQFGAIDEAWGMRIDEMVQTYEDLIDAGAPGETIYDESVLEEIAKQYDAQVEKAVKGGKKTKKGKKEGLKDFADLFWEAWEGRIKERYDEVIATQQKAYDEEITSYRKHVDTMLSDQNVGMEQRQQIVAESNAKEKELLDKRLNILELTNKRATDEAYMQMNKQVADARDKAADKLQVLAENAKTELKIEKDLDWQQLETEKANLEAREGNLTEAEQKRLAIIAGALGQRTLLCQQAEEQEKGIIATYNAKKEEQEKEYLANVAAARSEAYKRNIKVIQAEYSIYERYQRRRDFNMEGEIRENKKLVSVIDTLNKKIKELEASKKNATNPDDIKEANDEINRTNTLIGQLGSKLNFKKELFSDTDYSASGIAKMLFTDHFFDEKGKGLEQFKEHYANILKAMGYSTEEIKTIFDNMSDEDWGEYMAESIDRAADAIKDFHDMTLDYVGEMIDAWQELTQAKIDAAEEQVDIAQKQYDKEMALLEAGYANHVEEAEAEVVAKKKALEEAQANARKAAMAQEALDTAQQTSSLITASANIYKAMSGLGPWGIPLAIAMIATMFGSFAASKVMAMQAASKATYGEGHSELIDYGGTHASGNDVSLATDKQGRERRVERGEAFAVFNKKAVRRLGYSNIRNLVDGINKDSIREIPDLASARNEIFAINGGSAVDLSTIERLITDIAQNGRERTYTDKKGNTVVVSTNYKKTYLTA